MFKRIGKIIFKEVLEKTVEDFEKRISDLERKNGILETYVQDNKEDIRKINEDLREMNIIVAKAEATIKTMLFLSKDKVNQLGDGINK